MTNRKIKYWVIPPQSDAEFVVGMEAVLDLYEQPYNTWFPVVAMDEQPLQLLKETRQPISAARHHPKRIEYERAGESVSVLGTFGRLAAGNGPARRTKIDWAHEVADLLRGRYAKAEKVILVCDNLNTHMRAFYEAVDAATARSLVRGLEFCHTPKHGSWLSVAENELSSLTQQCVKSRRFFTVDELRAETTAWQTDVNLRYRGVDWQFRLDDARQKLKSLYPKSLFA